MILLLLSFNVFAIEEIIDNYDNDLNINNTIKDKVENEKLNIIIERYEDYISTNELILFPVIEDITNIDETILNDKDIYYNEFGGVIREDLDNSSIIIEDKLISVMDYNSTSELFEVSLFVGTNGTKYAIKHDNNSLNYNYISNYGDYLGDVISKDGYIYYETNKFSSQIATIPSYYQEGFLTDSGVLDEFDNILYSTSIISNDILELDLLQYYTGIEGFTICDYYDCYILDGVLENQQYYLGYESLLTTFPTGSNPILSDFTDINIYSGYNDFTIDGPYAYKMGAYNNEITLQLNSDDSTNYYSSFYLNYFFPLEPPIYNYRGSSYLITDGGFNTDFKFELSQNPSFLANSFDSDLITLDSDQNFGFKINPHFRNYDTWGFRLNDELGNPLANKQLSRSIDGCLSYTGSDIDIQICSDDYKADMLYINTKGLSFNGELEIYVLNSVYDINTEVSSIITLDVISPTTPPVLNSGFDDVVLGYYKYESIDIDDHISSYNSFNVNIDGGGLCDIDKVKDTGLSSTCNVNDVVYVIYPSGLITIESTNIPNSNIPIIITTTNDYGSVTDTFTLSVGANVGGLLLDLNAYWTLDNDLTDSTGNGHTLTNSGATYTSSGKINGAYEFDATISYITAGNIGEGYSQITVSAWFNTDDLIGTHDIVTNYVASGDRAFSISTNNDEISALIGDSSNNIAYSNTNDANLVVDTWYNVILTYDGTNTKLYLDGVEKFDVTGASGSLDTTTTDTEIGGRLGLSYLFDGQIDEPSIWSRALSATEVTELYNSGGYSSFSGGSSAIPPSITELAFVDVTLLPTEEYTLDMNDYFIGYDNIELKYYSSNTDEWFNIDLTFNDGVIENTFSDIIIKLEDGYSTDTSQTIFMSVQGNSMVYDDLVYITASNSAGSTTEQNFKVFVDYTVPVGQIPENILLFSNIGLEYNDFINLNLNNYYAYYDYITLTVGIDEITVYLDGTIDYGELSNSNYNITLTNLGTFIALNIESYNNNDEIDVNIQAFNSEGSDILRSFTLSINEVGTVVSDVPSWFPTPPESQKLYYAVGVMIMFIVGIAFIGANDEGLSSGLMAFAIIGLFGLFLLFSVVGWLPIWILILIIIVIVGYISFVTKKIIGG